MKRMLPLCVAAAMAWPAASGCSRCGEEKVIAPVPAAKVEAPAPAKAEPPAKVAEVAEAAKPPAGPVPEELQGVWEKVEQPFRGLRIEFSGATGMGLVPVVAPAIDDAEAAAFYAEKNRGDKALGKQFAACMPKVWENGAPKYTDLKPAADGGGWVGGTELRIIRITTCDRSRMKAQNVALALKSKDELVATVTDPRLMTTQIETWKRVK